MLRPFVALRFAGAILSIAPTNETATMIRTPAALIPYLLMLACFIGGLLWHAGDLTPRLGRNVAFGTADIGGGFALTDQNGIARTEADFHGRFMLIYFGYSDCPDVCPTTLNMIADALAKLGPKAARIVPVFITVDPARDTPPVLGTYMKSFGPQFVGLTGSAKAIAAVEHAYHVYVVRHALPGGGYAFDHSSAIYLMGPDGRFVAYFDESIGPDGLARALRERL